MISEHRSLSYERLADAPMGPIFGILLRLTPCFILPFPLGHLDGQLVSTTQRNVIPPMVTV
ncbi:hypothetical protein PILCRDRAFT_468376 [Piloderma croceum F 1598]|uniref:Uncharacterized protein n=1 Tax=Piloderma croceum (strain F 1598) TaxID=765440 RepID=A0A0C3B8L3_PILCF|nr:hypothetical protein PILCRDRAFT_468376 [Piloderma croceum F 1598]